MFCRKNTVEKDKTQEQHRIDLFLISTLNMSKKSESQDVLDVFVLERKYRQTV